MVLGHLAGSQRLHGTIRSRFYHRGLSVLCPQYQCPNNYSMCKNNRRQYCHFAPRQAPLAPCMECAVDLIGLWKITIYGRPMVFKALTAIDSITNLLEVIRINDKSSAHVTQQFSNCWLSRYPRPTIREIITMIIVQNILMVSNKVWLLVLRIWLYVLFY